MILPAVKKINNDNDSSKTCKAGDEVMRLSRSIRAIAKEAACHKSPARQLIHTTRVVEKGDDDDFRLKDLMAKFGEPGSPYYLEPGTSGPASPDEPPAVQATSSPIASVTSGCYVPLDDYTDSRDLAKFKFRDEGFPTEHLLEWPVAWGESDSFRHTNNVHFVRYFETARIEFVRNATDVLSEKTINDFLTGQNMGMILKDIKVTYKHPVNYPDRLLISSVPIEINQERGYFKLKDMAWSLATRRVAAVCEATIVMYDYNNLRKGTMSDEVRLALESRATTAGRKL